MKDNKRPYVCGPLTELPVESQKLVKDFYSRIADACEEIMGIRAFVPHEHYDPVKYPHFTPAEIDRAEREQVCEKTSLLIVVAIAPSWGGGIEVEMAYRSSVPVLILCEQGRKISRLLRGNPAVVGIIYYNSLDDSLNRLKDCISSGRALAEFVHDHNTARAR